VALMKAIFLSVCDIIDLLILTVTAYDGEQYLVWQARDPGPGTRNGLLEGAALGGAGRVFDVGMSILDDHMCFPKRPLYRYLAIDIKAVSIGGFTTLDLYVPASSAGSLFGDNHQGKDAGN
jgi:hypothetical protein